MSKLSFIYVLDFPQILFLQCRNSSVCYLFLLLYLASPREYLEHYVFPILLPAMEEMLKQAKLEICLEVCARSNYFQQFN